MLTGLQLNEQDVTDCAVSGVHSSNMRVDIHLEVRLDTRAVTILTELERK